MALWILCMVLGKWLSKKIILVWSNCDLNEKIVIKKENTTSSNVKEKLNKDGEKEKQDREKQERGSWETTCIAKVALSAEVVL